MACDRLSWEQRQRWRWEKPNAHLWLRENVHLYRKPPPFDRAAWLQEREEATREVAESHGLALTPEDITEYRAGIARIRAEVAALRLFLRLRRKAGFDPNQPRVPAGNPDGGQWTGGEGGEARTDRPERIRLAGPSGVLSRRQAIAIRFPEATPAQHARLAIAEAQADAAVGAVRTIDPHWRTTPSVRETIEGHIASEQANAREARERLDVFNRLGITSATLRPDGLARPHEEILAPGGRVVGVQSPGAGPNITTVSRIEFERLRDELLAGARPVETQRDYRGLWFDRHDGFRFGLRISRDHGPTIDVLTKDHPGIPDNFKVHQR